jgi:cytidine deaminase
MQYPGLISAARKVREMSYSPYSKFAVGAALLSKNGTVFVGCNVENASLGLTICAERAALAAALAGGHREFEAIAIVADSRDPALPCGACRQVLAEFNPALTVIAVTATGEQQQVSISELLPFPNQGLFEDVRVS